MSLPTPGRDTAMAALATVARINDPLRTRRLDALEALWKGLAYKGRPSFWDAEVPLNERAPAVCSTIAETAGTRLVSMVFGNRCFPTLTVGDGDVDVALSDDERATLNSVIARLVTVAKLRPTMKASLTQGLMCGTLVAVARVAHGKPSVQILPAKWCSREQAPSGEIASLEVRYRYSGHDATGQPCMLWYRRVIDATHDVTYKPAEAREDGHEPMGWTVDPERSVEHGCGFCPVLWHRNNADVSDLDDTDGCALFDGLEDEIFALDMAMSQRHRNGRYNGEPQMVQTGVDADATALPLGEPGRTAGAPPAGFSWFDSVIAGARKLVGGGQSATKKAPGKIWKLPTGGDAKLLESSGAGAQILQLDIDGLRRTILEARGIVIASPETVAANASAALLKELYAPMVAVADGYRDEYGPVLEALVNLLLRVCAVQRRRKKLVLLAGLDAVVGVLSRFEKAIDDGSSLWAGVPLSVAWGEYFEPTFADLQAAVGAASTAVGGGRAVLSRRTAVKALASVVLIDDLDAELAEIEREESLGQDGLGRMLGSLAGEAQQTPETTQTSTDPLLDATATNDPAQAAQQGAAAAQGDLPEVFGYDYDAGIITVNEARARKGLPSLPGGDVSVPVWKATQAAEAARIMASVGVSATDAMDATT